MKSVRVAVVGYGVVGKRVADAVALQPDMELAGVVDVIPNDLVRTANTRGYPIYAGTQDAVTSFQAAGIPTAGAAPELMENIDIAVDCAPPGITGKNIALYKEHGVRHIVQGGEKHSLTGISFSALANYREAWGRDSVRVVSCNTTSQCRTLSTLERAFGLDDVFIAITRRAVDPPNVKGGPVNAVIATLPGFSHHAPDIQTVIPGIKVRSMAVVAPSTLMHVHTLRATLRNSADADSVRKLFAETPRFRLVSGQTGTTSTAHIIEWARDASRPRNDHWEVAVWEDSIVVEDGVLHLLMAVHMESVIVPENIDCIRSMCELEDKASDSIYRTDQSLGIARAESEYQKFNSAVN